jgi:hypothetical protein
LTGITLLIFSSLLIALVYTICLKEPTLSPSVKILFSICLVILFSSFIYCKYVCENLYQVSNEMNFYEKKRSLNKNRFYSNCLFIFAQIITSVIILCLVLYSGDTLDQIFRLPEHNLKYNYHFISFFYYNGYIFSIQFFVFEILSKHYNLIEFYDKYLKTVIKNHLFNTENTRNIIKDIVINFERNERLLITNVKYFRILILILIIMFNFTAIVHMFVADSNYFKILVTLYLSILNYYYLSTQLILHLKRNVKTSLMKTLRTLESMDTFEEAMISLMPFRSTNTWVCDKIHIKRDSNSNEIGIKQANK